MGKLYKKVTLPILLVLVLLFYPVTTGMGAETKASRIRTDTTDFDTNLSAADVNVQTALETLDEVAGGSGAPTDVDYLVGTADGGLSAEIVVGTSPGGELGGTWASPTIDDSLAVTSWNLTTPTFTTTALLVGILQDNDDMVFECDADSNGTNSYSFTDGASTEIANLSEAGNLQIDGTFTIATSAILSGGDTTSLNLIDAIDATTETTLEGALDIGGEVTSTGMGSTVIADSITVTGWVMGASTATTPSADDNDTSLATTAYVQGEINGAGGRSLTCSSGSCDADDEAVIYTWRYGSYSPVDTDDIAQVDYFKYAVTLTEFRCYSDQTVVVQLQRDDGSAANIFTANVTCDADGGSACASGCDTTLVDAEDNCAATNKLGLVTISVSGTPTKNTMVLFGTYDD
jgi:hypothetical protein